MTEAESTGRPKACHFRKEHASGPKKPERKRPIPGAEKGVTDFTRTRTGGGRIPDTIMFAIPSVVRCPMFASGQPTFPVLYQGGIARSH